MMFIHTIVASILLLATGSVASYGASSSIGVNTCSAPAPTASGQGQSVSQVLVQVVQVSNDSKALKYFPESLTAQPGTLVQFQFHPANHTVTQSTFDNPCVPISKIMPNVTGIKSGFMPVAANASEIPVFTIQINDTKPIWIYCGQPTHCQKGMAMVINQQAGSNKTLEAYKAAAALVPENTTATTPPAGSMSISSSIVAATTISSSPLTSTATVLVAPTAAASASTSTFSITTTVSNGNSNQTVPTGSISSAPAQQTTNAAGRAVAGYGTMGALLMTGIVALLI